ncbi:MAG: hypothetical protein WAW63_02135 [Candidatus Saccharimonadales bacterium]|jgi:hypothetical protein
MKHNSHVLTLFISLVVPLVVYTFAHMLFGEHPEERWWVVVACLLFFLSYFVPSPLVHGQETQYMTHFVGGGLFSGFLWLYITRVNKLRLNLAVEATSLFVLVSTLGVMNELFETVLFWLGHMPAGIADTSWDLVANSTGALSFYLVYKGIQWLRSV